MMTESMVSASNCSTRRILRELMDLKRHPHPAIEIFPSDRYLIYVVLKCNSITNVEKIYFGWWIKGTPCTNCLLVRVQAADVQIATT